MEKQKFLKSIRKEIEKASFLHLHTAHTAHSANQTL